MSAARHRHRASRPGRTVRRTQRQPFTKEIGTHAGNPRMFALQRVLTTALLSLSLAGVVALVQQFGAVV